MRNGEITEVGQRVHCDDLKMCRCGLHASITPEGASQYAPVGSVLTKVQVWGRVQFGRDKLVATDRRIIERIEDAKCSSND